MTVLHGRLLNPKNHEHGTFSSSFSHCLHAEHPSSPSRPPSVRCWLASTAGVLEELARRLPMGMAIVTGRPRGDCDYFLKKHGRVQYVFDKGLAKAPQFSCAFAV